MQDPTELQEQGWWFGRIDARLGFLPANYVEEVSLQAPAAASPGVPCEDGRGSQPTVGDEGQGSEGGKGVGTCNPLRVPSGSPDSSILLHEIPWVCVHRVPYPVINA